MLHYSLSDQNLLDFYKKLTLLTIKRNDIFFVFDKQDSVITDHLVCKVLTLNGFIGYIVVYNLSLRKL